MAYFDGIKVGDTVYNVEMAYQVISVFEVFFRVMRRFGKDNEVTECLSVSMRGEAFGQSVQTWFWQPVHIDPPPRPKRKVSKTFQGFLNPGGIRALQEMGHLSGYGIYDESISQFCPVTVTIEYEE